VTQHRCFRAKGRLFTGWWTIRGARRFTLRRRLYSDV